MRVLRPPQWPYKMNRASPQANGLIGWFPFVGRGGDPLARNLALGTAYATDGSAPTFPGDPIMRGVPNWGGNVRYTVKMAGGGIGETEFSIAGVFKRVDSAATTRLLVTIGSSATDDDLIQFGPRRDTQLVVRFYNEDLDVTVPSMANTWTWLVATFRTGANGQKLYMQGVQIGERTNNTGFKGTQTYRIGDHYIRGTAPFNGPVADVRFYNRVLSADEAWQMWDPMTRWELYDVVRRVWVLSPGGAPPASRRRSWATIIGG